MTNNARLCYVDAHRRAYFTTCPLNRQWGDDWDDAPYEHNAGPPYEWAPHRNVAPYEIVVVCWDGPWSTPADVAGSNSRWSVEAINRGDVAWLIPDDEGRPIHAGVTVEEFKRAILAGGGRVWVEEAGPCAA